MRGRAHEEAALLLLLLLPSQAEAGSTESTATDTSLVSMVRPVAALVPGGSASATPGCASMQAAMCTRACAQSVEGGRGYGRRQPAPHETPCPREAFAARLHPLRLVGGEEDAQAEGEVIGGVQLRRARPRGEQELRRRGGGTLLTHARGEGWRMKESEALTLG